MSSMERVLDTLEAEGYYVKRSEKPHPNHLIAATEGSVADRCVFLKRQRDTSPMSPVGWVFIMKTGGRAGNADRRDELGKNPDSNTVLSMVRAALDEN